MTGYAHICYSVSDNCINPGYVYPATPTDIKIKPTDIIIELHKECIERYNESKKYADWRNLKRLHDLFGLYLPEGDEV